MSVHDILIFVVIAAFTSSVIPIIRAGIVLPLKTSLIMAVGSLILAVVYFDLALWLSFAIEVVSTILWAVLLYRNVRD